MILYEIYADFGQKKSPPSGGQNDECQFLNHFTKNWQAGQGRVKRPLLLYLA